MAAGAGLNYLLLLSPPPFPSNERGKIETFDTSTTSRELTSPSSPFSNGRIKGEKLRARRVSFPSPPPSSFLFLPRHEGQSFASSGSLPPPPSPFFFFSQVNQALDRGVDALQGSGTSLPPPLHPFSPGSKGRLAELRQGRRSLPFPPPSTFPPIANLA